MATEKLKQSKEIQEALWQELNESESEKVAGGGYYYDPYNDPYYNPYLDPSYVIANYFNTTDPYGSLLFDY